MKWCVRVLEVGGKASCNIVVQGKEGGVGWGEVVAAMTHG